MDQVGKAIAGADGVRFAGTGCAESADRPTEAMVDAAHKAVWLAFWAINSRADPKKAVRAMIRAATGR